MSSTENYPKRIIFATGYSYTSYGKVEKLGNFLQSIAPNYRGPKIMVELGFISKTFFASKK